MENQAWVYILRFQTIQTSSRLQQNQEKFVKYTSRSKESIIIKQLEEGKIAN